MSGIDPWAGYLDEQTARHLLRRTSFGVAPDRLASVVDRPATEVVADLVEEARSLTALEPPTWYDSAPPGRGSSTATIEAYNAGNNAWVGELRWNWIGGMRERGLRERMTLFWHNHFVTEQSVYFYAVFAVRYLDLLRLHALGNFRQLVHEIGLSPAMLRYLDGYVNQSGAPNENYARELLELFTMSPVAPDGTPNYTEPDIRELSRALTGWQLDPRSMAAVFNPALFDTGDKTVFGQTGPFGYDDVIQLIFDQRSPQIADHVARRLYTRFCHAEPDPEFCADLAAVLLANDFELAPTLTTLLSSERFFDVELRGAAIKSPVDLTLGLVTTLDLPVADDGYAVLERSCRALSQTLLDPPGVAGWPEHHDWLSTSLLPLRWAFTDGLFSGRQSRTIDFADIGVRLADPGDPDHAFRLPLVLTERLFAVGPEALDLPPIDAPFAGDLVTHPIPDWVLASPEHVVTLAKMFLAGLPWYEWSPYAIGSGTRIAAFLQELAHLPEFQLN